MSGVRAVHGAYPSKAPPSRARRATAARVARASGTLIAIAAVTWLLGTLAVTSAQADFGPIELQSVGALDQFEAASEAATSADGRYLAFQGMLDGVEGVWRKDLSTGQAQLVAGGSIYTPVAGAPSDAFAPSISADGRYVSFTTAAALVKSAHSGKNVFVRDMQIEVPATQNGVCGEAEEHEKNCAYELVSALNGGTEGVTYCAASGEGSGSVATGRVALSASGREVAFVTLGASNLASRPEGCGHDAPTPGLQVAVRYLDRHETVLVSAERDASTGQMTESPTEGGAVTPTTEMESNGGRRLPGAALSADGTTVAWLGAHIPAQVPVLSDERQQMEDDDRAEPHHYDEPLWRRIADGASAPTRRMVGGGDPFAPGCPPGGTLEVPACRGPFPELDTALRGDEESNLGWLGIAGYDGVPQLSADGWTAALIGDPGGTSNVFVVNMSEGLDRIQAVRQLTREMPVPLTVNPGTQPQYKATAGDVLDIGISPDGSKIAFTTQREQFPLAPPNFTEPPLAQIGVPELYQIDLDAESLQRVTHGPGGGPSLAAGESAIGAGASAPSYSENGDTLAFASSASNLVSGDANGSSDVFTTLSTSTTAVAGPASIGPTPPSQEPTVVQWRLSVVPVVNRNGSVTLDVVVPGAGELQAKATAIVPVTVHVTRRARKAATSKKSRSKPATRVELKSRSVASAGMSARLPGLLELPLRVSPPYKSLLSTPAGIYATVKVTFTGKGEPLLSQTAVLSLRAIKQKGKAEQEGNGQKGKVGRKGSGGKGKVGQKGKAERSRTKGHSR